MSRTALSTVLRSPGRRPGALRRSTRTVGVLVLVAAALTAGAPTLIRIRPGDTLSGIALQHHTTVAILQALNHMGGSTLIYAGAVLAVPGQGGPASDADAPPAPAHRTQTRVELRTYAVQPGDGLISVAALLHTTPAALVAVNHLHRDYLLLGEHLRYPVRVTVTIPVTGAGRHASVPFSDPLPPIPGALAASARRDRATLAGMATPDQATVRSLIERTARRDGVPVPLALGVAYQESGFQQQVVSPVDAIGAMQVLPSTALALGRLHGRRFDLLKASDDVAAGVLLLKDLLVATNSVEQALEGYYQGLGSVAAIGVLPQTRQYVRDVLALAQRFG